MYKFSYCFYWKFFVLEICTAKLFGRSLNKVKSVCQVYVCRTGGVCIRYARNLSFVVVRSTNVSVMIVDTVLRIVDNLEILRQMCNISCYTLLENFCT